MEIRINPDTGADHLLAVQRHPTVPKYIDVAELHGDVDLVACLDEAMEVMCQGVLPNVVDVGTCPPELADIVVAALQRGWDGRLADSDLSYANTADHIRSTLGEPWGYAHHSHKTDRFADEIAKRPEVTKDATFADWLALASDQLNVEANIANMTNAWDGSLNFQNSHGTLGKGYFDRGPFFLRYSDFGTVDPHTGRDASHHPPR